MRNPRRDILFPLFACVRKEIKTRKSGNLNNIISHLNDLLCRLFKLLILFKENSISFEQLIMSFVQENQRGN